jgi:hypothetical protein
MPTLSSAGRSLGSFTQPLTVCIRLMGRSGPRDAVARSARASAVKTLPAAKSASSSAWNTARSVIGAAPPLTTTRRCCTRLKVNAASPLGAASGGSVTERRNGTPSLVATACSLNPAPLTCTRAPVPVPLMR